MSDTRGVASGDYRYRIYKCRCGARWNTIEKKVSGRRGNKQKHRVGERFDKQQGAAVKARFMTMVKEFLNQL